MLGSEYESIAKLVCDSTIRVSMANLVVPDDIVEQILVRLSVKDVLRFKSVCKSWLSIISGGSRFIKSHLNHSDINDRNNNELGHRRIIVPMLPHLNNTYRSSFSTTDNWPLLGSSNGLISLLVYNGEVVVANPLTREMRKFQTPQAPTIWSSPVCWGFGYDSLRDDYKVVLGFKTPSYKENGFYVLTLKSNAWKVIGNVKYTYHRRFGVLCNGAIHWYMNDRNGKKVIISLDLSFDEFKEIAQPDHDALHKYNCQTELTVIKECLCIIDVHSSKIWVMKNYNVKQTWELLAYDCKKNLEINNDNAYYLRNLNFTTLIKESFFEDHYPCSTWEFILSPAFVQSLVSPYVYGRLKRKRDANVKQLVS